MIPRLKPRLGLREVAAAFTPPSSKDIELFEAQFAETMNVKYAVAFPYGRTALIFLLQALGLKDKEIITPAYTCVVVQHSVVYSGNRPVFVDSQASDFNMDMEKVGRLISPQTGAIIATSIFGYPCDLDKLNQVSKQSGRNIPIIQDCAHSFGAEWKGQPVHQAGIAAIYGMNISKLLTSVFGGMVTTNDADLAARLKQLRQEKLLPVDWKKSFMRLSYLLAVYPAFWGPIYTLINWLERSGVLNRFTKYFDAGKIDMPLDYLDSLTHLEARVGRVNIQRYSDILKRRREIAEFYSKELQLENFNLPPIVSGATYSHYVVQVPNRHAWMRAALQKGLQLGQLIEYNVPEMPAYGACNSEDYPIAARFSKNTINLPIWGNLKMAKKVVKIIRETHAELDHLNCQQQKPIAFLPST